MQRKRTPQAYFLPRLDVEIGKFSSANELAEAPGLACLKAHLRRKFSQFASCRVRSFLTKHVPTSELMICVGANAWSILCPFLSPINAIRIVLGRLPGLVFSCTLEGPLHAHTQPATHVGADGSSRFRGRSHAKEDGACGTFSA